MSGEWLGDQALVSDDAGVDERFSRIGHVAAPPRTRLQHPHGSTGS